MSYKLYIKDNLESITDEELERMLDALPEWRREKAMRFKFRQGRLECALGYHLLCDALAEQYGITESPAFEYGEHGKPILTAHPGVYFNISHCKSAVACVLSDSEVGVDVESMGRFNESLARYVLCDEEYELVMKAADKDEEFIKYWTKKEAVLKLTGEGLTDDVKSILNVYNNVRVYTRVNKEKAYAVSVSTY